jgi:LysM repeat protein
MNNLSPFIPQGSLVEQKNRGRARVKIAVFFVLAVHGVGLLALLMQGCRRDEKEGAGSDASTNAADTTAAFAPTNTGVDTNLPATNPTPIVEQVVTPPAAAPTEYVIARNDTFSSLASKFKVSVRAIQDANPGVDPNKLQIGQKIKIPPPAPASSATPRTAGGTTPIAADGEQIYTVISGDTLTTIAQKKGTTVRELRSANNLTTDRITVGQKLKIPAKSATAQPAPGTTTPPGGGAR